MQRPTATTGNTGLRVILFMGMGTFLFLLLVAFALRQSFQPREATRVPAGSGTSPFQAARAWADLEHLVALGPRPAGSEAMAAQQRYVRDQLRSAGLALRTFSFQADTGRGPVPMVTLAGVIRGSRPGTLVLATHYDTRYLPDIPFVGANDGGSGTAWLLEMARVLGPTRDGRSLWLVFLDGQEPQGADDHAGGGYGSRHLAKALAASGDRDAIEAVIDVGMIGDCYLTIDRDDSAPKWLEEIVWNTAQRHGYGAHFGRTAARVDTGHHSVRFVGIPELRLTDSRYGPLRVDHGRNLHSARDTLDKVCPGSLRAVGDVIYHALPVLDGHLDMMGARSHGS